jgi:streptogramin lyase
VYAIVYDQGSVAASPKVYGALPKRPARLALDSAHFAAQEGWGPAYRFSFQEGGRPILIFVKLGASVSTIARTQTEQALGSLRYVPLSVREQTIKLPGAPSDVDYDDGSVWVTSEGPAALGGSLLRIDSGTSRVLNRIRLPGVTDYSQIAVGADAVWVSDSGKSNVYRVNPRTDRVVATVHLGGSPVNIATGAGGVWVDDDSSGRLDKINPATNRLVARIELPDSVGPMAVAGGSVWVIDTRDGQGQSLLRINPANDKITERVPLYGNATSVRAIAASGPYLWLGDRRFLVTQINTRSGAKITTLVAGGDAIGAYGTVAFGVGPAGGGSTTGIAIQLDANHREGAPTYPIGRVPVAVAVGPDAAWVANFEDATLTRIAYH